MKDKIPFIITSVVLIVIGTIIGLYSYKFGGANQLSGNRGDWGTFGDYFGGILNPIIGLMTLAITVYIAVKFNAYEIRRDVQSKEASDIKSYLELYQFFTGPEFSEKRLIAWIVIRRALVDPNYKDILVNEAFVSKYDNKQYDEDKWKQYTNPDFHQQLKIRDKQDRRNEFISRHHLQSVINFFQLLSTYNVPNKYSSICDFYYDSWRPMLYWYANELENAYNASEANKFYNNPPTLKEALKNLDTQYLKSQGKSELIVSNIESHPILEWYLKGKKK